MLGMVARDVLLGWRRLGQKNSDNQPRPLLLIFKTKADRDRMLDRAPGLSRNRDEEYRSISIVADLTQKQRKLEQEMFNRAEKLNLERSPEKISKNLVHKVLGRRGERVLRQVELRDREMVNEQGKVVDIEQGEDFRTNMGKRGATRSPGNSPPSRRRFGGRE